MHKNTNKASYSIVSTTDLKKGDILIRRYINKNTLLPTLIFKTYFTHTAFYDGDGMIYQAVGDNLHKAKEISTSRLEDSDFADLHQAELLLVLDHNFLHQLLNRLRIIYEILQTMIPMFLK